ncbi:leucine-rich repeat domain-containing protein [Leyella stercorea]|uniref:leucine-rich repeat domain-containing protein n=1 Tax=Leyella stercorea TaxID=363265 RepID=UPI003AF4475D
MRNFTFKGLLLTAVFMLLGCLSIQAANDDLITKQITIKLDKAGTLPTKIAVSRKNLITNLKIVGEINGTDWNMIREMAGRNYQESSTEGNLSVLDLSEAKIVAGGDYYYYDNLFNNKVYTSNDEIGEYAFAYCSGLTSLTLPVGITSIGEFAFSGCSGLTSLTLPAGITSIGEYAFYGCSGLTSLTLPAGITEIGESTFSDCSGLTSLTLPDGITSIGISAFKGCSGLTSLTLPAGITSIDKYAFLDCSGLTSLTLHDGITSIGSRAFYGCSGLTSLTLPAGITSIGDDTFYGCSGLTSFTLPAGITSIGEFAFSYCSGLTSIYVYAEKVPRIGRYAFEGCASRKCTLYVPKGTYDNYRLSEFGYFENIVEFDPTGIDKTTTSTDVEEVSRYSLNGQRLVGPTKGLNIVKYSDGSVKKVAVE